MSNRFFVEGCLAGGCVMSVIWYGALPLIACILGLITAEIAIEKMKRSNFTDKLDQQVDRRRARL